MTVLGIRCAMKQIIRLKLKAKWEQDAQFLLYVLIFNEFWSFTWIKLQYYWQLTYDNLKYLGLVLIWVWKTDLWVCFSDRD